MHWLNCPCGGLLLCFCVYLSICNHVSMCIMKRKKVLFCYRINAINGAPQRGLVAGLYVPLAKLAIAWGLERNPGPLCFCLVWSCYTERLSQSHLSSLTYALSLFFYSLTHTHLQLQTEYENEAKGLAEGKNRKRWMGREWEEGKRGQWVADACPLLGPPTYTHTHSREHNPTPFRSLSCCLKTRFNPWTIVSLLAWWFVVSKVDFLLLFLHPYKVWNSSKQFLIEFQNINNELEEILRLLGTTGVSGPKQSSFHSVFFSVFELLLSLTSKSVTLLIYWVKVRHNHSGIT